MDGHLTRRLLRRMDRAVPSIRSRVWVQGMCEHTYIHTYIHPTATSSMLLHPSTVLERLQSSIQKNGDGDGDGKEESESIPKPLIRNKRLEKGPSKAAQIPRCPTTAPTRSRHGPRRHGPQPQPLPPQNRRPPQGPQSGAAQRGGDQSGPGEARIRQRAPVGNRPGAKLRCPSSSPLLFQGLLVSMVWSPAAASGIRQQV